MKLLETLLCSSGIVHHIPYHQARMDKSYKLLFGTTNPMRLRDIITPPPKGTYRCRVLYDATGYEVEYVAYEVRFLNTFNIIHTTISYNHKFADRSMFSAIKDGCDENIYIQEGFVTDTSIANIACRINNEWFTPHTPLLEGTTRARLIDEGFLKVAPITLQTLLNADSIAMMNALTGFYEVPRVHIKIN